MSKIANMNDEHLIERLQELDAKILAQKGTQDDIAQHATTAGELMARGYEIDRKTTIIATKAA